MEGTRLAQFEQQSGPFGLLTDDLSVCPCAVGEGEPDAGVTGPVADQLLDRVHEAPLGEWSTGESTPKVGAQGPLAEDLGTNLEHVAIYQGRCYRSDVRFA